MGLVLLVRHGQASFGADDYDVLSEPGFEQSRVLGRWLAAAGIEPVAVLHGAMRRQRDTATAMVEGAAWALETGLDVGWNEFDHLGVVARGLESLDDAGRAALDDRRGFQRAFEDATARWAGGEHDAEYDESWPEFVARVSAALERACARDGTTVVVSSGGPIAVACAALVDPAATAAELPRLWRRFNTVIVNSAVSRVLVGSTGRRLLTFNEHSHLARDLVTYR
ncbi:histidine phosphatase family protein [Nocardioides cynanchi]|uniref:histidine phosphatase family protein n=1 Tax=Nocardioides cynanchi TaxID=2558918 RepID=UPI00124662EA|nr:histidine phosphatase family protein [Nocardioides cynanchi]